MRWGHNLISVVSFQEIIFLSRQVCHHHLTLRFIALQYPSLLCFFNSLCKRGKDLETLNFAFVLISFVDDNGHESSGSFLPLPSLVILSLRRDVIFSISLPEDSCLSLSTQSSPLFLKTVLILASKPQIQSCVFRDKD